MSQTANRENKSLIPFIPVNKELENTFPDWLKRSIAEYKHEYQRYLNHDPYVAFDAVIGDFQSDINNAEVNGVISSDAAWYIREAYLGMSRKDLEL